jgi:hypothetical protein
MQHKARRASGRTAARWCLGEAALLTNQSHEARAAIQVVEQTDRHRRVSSLEPWTCSASCNRSLVVRCRNGVTAATLCMQAELLSWR